MRNTIIELQYTKLNIITIVALCGTDVHDCIAEAIGLSSRLGCPVVLLHNNRSFKIDSDKITDKIYTDKVSNEI